MLTGNATRRSSRRVLAESGDDGSARDATTSPPGPLHYASADRWVSMPNGAQGSLGRGRSGVEAGPTLAPWRSAPTF